MSAIEKIEASVEVLLDAVAKLSPKEQAEFERRFLAKHHQRRLLHEKVSQCAKSLQFSPQQQKRLNALLVKNKEGEILPEEERELDDLIEALDQRKLQLADEIQKLAHASRGDSNADEPGKVS